jgi:anti-sigma factor RsiW
MSCEKYSGWLTDAALGELGAEREPELLAHAMECGACREALAHAREVREFVDRGVESLVAGEPSAQFATRLRQRIAQESEPPRSSWAAWAPVAAGALALAVVLAITVARRPVHNESNPSVASAVNPFSVPSEPVTGSAATPQNPEPKASKPNSGHHAQARKAATARAEIIVPKGQLSAAAQLSAAINSGRVDGNQLVAAQEEYDKPLEVKLIEIAPMEIPALDAATEKPAGSIQF